MTPRTLTFIILTALVGIAPPISAKDKKNPARTWKTVVDYVFANGTERTIKGPLSRHLGFESDVVVTKALRIKLSDSPDNKNHAFYVISSEDSQGKPLPKQFVVGNAVVVKNDGPKSVDDFFVRADSNGNIIAAVSSKGPAGQVQETVLTPDSPEAVAGLKSEQTIFLKTIALEKLRK